VIDMEGLFLGLGIVLACVLLASVIGTVLRLAFWLLFLPFRLVGWLLYLPLLLVKLVIGVVAAVLTPIVAVVAAVLAAVVAAVFLPFFPVLLIAGLVWLVVKASRRPNHRPAVS
jgi:hypothetical protein